MTLRVLFLKLDLARNLPALILASPPSIICTGSSSNVYLTNSFFIYSPSQRFAAGVVNDRFGVYVANGYNSVTNIGIWLSPGSTAQPGAHLVAQFDRNLVIYASGTGALWASHTAIGYTGYTFCLHMLDNGALIWTDPWNNIIWRTS